MEKIVIRGGNRLKGEVQVSGAKNSALPLLFATLLAPGVHRVSNVPQLRDITTVVSGEHVNITDVRDRRNGDKSVTISLTVEIAGLAQASRLLNRLEGLPGVDSVYRVAGTGQAIQTKKK